jgi:hypothetical protein
VKNIPSLGRIVTRKTAGLRQAALLYDSTSRGFTTEPIQSRIIRKLNAFFSNASVMSLWTSSGSTSKKYPFAWSRSSIFLRARSQSTARRSPRSLALGRAIYPLTTVTRPLLRRRKLLNISLVDWFELFSNLTEVAVAFRTRIAEMILESSVIGEPRVPRDSSEAKNNLFTAIELTRACA